MLLYTCKSEKNSAARVLFEINRFETPISMARRVVYYVATLTHRSGTYKLAFVPRFFSPRASFRDSAIFASFFFSPFARLGVEEVCEVRG